MKNNRNVKVRARKKSTHKQSIIKFGDLSKMINDTIDLFRPGIEKFNISFELNEVDSNARFAVTAKIESVTLLIIQKFISKRYSDQIIKIKFKLCFNNSTLEPEKLKIRFSSNLPQKSSKLLQDPPNVKKVKIKPIEKKNESECFDAEFHISPVVFNNMTLDRNIVSYYQPAEQYNLQSDDFIEEFKDHIASYKTIENVCFDKLCDHFAMSRSTLYRRIKLSTGMSPSKFIKTHYLGMAANRLIDTNDPITDIAYDFGFNNSSYFSKSFKEHFSESPLRFRNKNKHKNGRFL
ncbi:MAG: helix-turn-helix domain-containing protein [Rhodothermaceae bacterium]